VRGHLLERRLFKPTLRGGGSRPGKAQNTWPIGILVVAEALYRRSAGGMEQLTHNRAWAKMGLTPSWLKKELEVLLPGVWAWVEIYLPAKTLAWKRLHNRIFKMYYNGTSARGVNHDPFTRASISREHWTNKVPEGNFLIEWHTKVDRGLVHVIPQWQKVF